jgi:hypothetical protein
MNKKGAFILGRDRKFSVNLNTTETICSVWTLHSCSSSVLIKLLDSSSMNEVDRLDQIYGVSKIPKTKRRLIALYQQISDSCKLHSAVCRQEWLQYTELSADAGYSVARL